MLIRKLMIFLMVLCLSACTTPEPTQTGDNLSADSPKEIAWEQAKEMIFSGEVETIVQSHDQKVILEHKNGNRFITVEPELDIVIQIAKQCGAKCSTMDIMTE